MRTITDHIVEGDSANHQLTITVIDKPGSGGANHRYLIQAPHTDIDFDIDFQNGPIAEAGINGLTHEALAAIIIDRLRSFHNGPFASRYNSSALDCFKQGLDWLQQRTRDRLERGVEGTHQK